MIATVPSPIFLELLGPELAAEVGSAYRKRVDATEYHTALCLVLEIERGFTPFYWTNVADRDLDFIGLIEHTNLIPPARYGGRRFLYVANYVEPGDRLLELSAEELLAHYLPGLRKVNPSFAPGWVRSLRLYREPAAQPIVRVGREGSVPTLRTPAPGLVLANTTQIYPEDRGTNYSVRLGEQAVEALLTDGASPPPP